MENNKSALQALEEVRTFIPNTRQDSVVVIEQALNDYARMQKVAEHSVKAYYRTSERFLKIFEKKDQLLKVLKNKKVDIFLVDITDCVEEYNELLGGNRKKYPLTEEEYNLLKEWLNNGKWNDAITSFRRD